MTIANNTEQDSGVLLVDKPKGWTSHDIVAKLRGILKMKRIGHAGTLDPMATGLLIILVGKATKASQYLMTDDKIYEGTIQLGVSTDSYDAEGTVTETKDVPEIEEEQFIKYMEEQVGDQEQTPPMFSAVKVNGKRLYKSARKGQEVERKSRMIQIRSFDFLSYKAPALDFSLHCSKGTYVRTIGHELGQHFSCGGHLNRLRRNKSGDFSIEDATTMEHLLEMDRESILKKLISYSKYIPNKIIPPQV